MDLVIFARRSHDEAGATTSEDWTPDPAGKLESIEPGMLAKPGVSERSCCCAAPPRVRVLLPVPGHEERMVDILLCHHHYRLSRPRLAELEGLCINASSEPLDEPEPVDSLPGPRERA